MAAKHGLEARMVIKELARREVSNSEIAHQALVGRTVARPQSSRVDAAWSRAPASYGVAAEPERRRAQGEKLRRAVRRE